MVTKLGQKALRQEKSLLQLDWSIVRLRPNSVSSGLTETQFDLSEQSPHPSHTASLMTTRLGGSGKVPRLRRRRFSAAQVSSEIRVWKPGTSRISRFTLSSSPRWRLVVPGPESVPGGYLSGSSLTTTICLS